MENKDTNADCQKVARGPKVVEVTIGIFFFFFFCLKFIFTIFYARSFQVPPEKNHPPPKVLIPTQNLNLTYVPPV